ncbi:MAG: tRNA pseudouridine(38-40) synthase TruA [Candidatus Omnitrophica bacterium]|nr:tRNA pseudouridine(38-40) synthase TruA [Candidatus Omnitrophota bacterium]
MRNIKLVLEYEGSAFFGFQKQPDHPTVQEALEKALSQLFNHSTKITAASGRTDTGAHAEYQVVNFKTKSSIPSDKIQKALNGILPKMIAVKEAHEMPARFHARYQVKNKVYEYRIWNDAVRSPLQSAQTYHIPGPLDLKKMRQGAKVLSGRHDLRAFCSANGVPGSQKNTVRKIFRFDIKREGHLIRLIVMADGFLYHMMRNLAGTLIRLGAGRMSLKELKAVLKSRDRKQAGSMVPASGLRLVNVTYDSKRG